MYSDRVVIPAELQKRILKEFHVSHPRISRMKGLMKSHVYWTNIGRDIEDTIKACNGCALTTKAPPIKLSPWSKSDWPWSKIYIDFADPLDDLYYLIVVDSFSKWLEICNCKKATTKVVPSFLHELLTRFGVVDFIVSDNGTQFMSNDCSVSPKIPKKLWSGDVSSIPLRELLGKPYNNFCRFIEWLLIRMFHLPGHQQR